MRIRKANGELQPFSPEKLTRALANSGATPNMIDEVVRQVQRKLHDGISSKEIYREAFRLLRQMIGSVAARFSLKTAIMELGPTGYPFEHLVGEIFRKQGFVVQKGVIIQGRCVQHEIDVIGQKENQVILVECKYHNTPGNISNVQVPLYVHSRFKDIELAWSLSGNIRQRLQGWLFTNTRFSTDAIEFGECSGLKMVGWDYPEKQNLKFLLQHYGLFPLTVLTGLTRKQKNDLLDKGCLLCSDLMADRRFLDEMRLPDRKMKEIHAELHELSLLSSLHDEK